MSASRYINKYTSFISENKHLCNCDSNTYFANFNKFIFVSECTPEKCKCNDCEKYGKCSKCDINLKSEFIIKSDSILLENNKNSETFEISVDFFKSLMKRIEDLEKQVLDLQYAPGGMYMKEAEQDFYKQAENL